MTEQNGTKVGPALCRFPGCQSPPEPGDGRGRPPAYCEDPAHTRAAAFRARREADPAAGESVSFARMRAGVLVERVEAAVVTLGTLSEAVMGELATLGDVELVEVELESVTASAEARVAEARALAAEAEVRRRCAQDETAALREELDTTLKALLDSTQEHAIELIEVRQAHAQVVEAVHEQIQGAKADLESLLEVHQQDLERALEQARKTHAAQLEGAHAVARAADVARAEAQKGADRLAAELVSVMEEADTARERAAQAAAEAAMVVEVAHLREVADMVTSLREQEEVIADARERIAGFSAQLHAEHVATATAAEVAARNTAEQVSSVRSFYEERIAELRAQMTALAQQQQHERKESP